MLIIQLYCSQIHQSESVLYKPIRDIFVQMPTSPHSYRYRVVDVFTQQALEGNQLAVFPDASGIDDVTMQKIAKELNLSETVFILPATRQDCAVSVRIFVPTRELPFAGHPTIGASFVVLDERIVPSDRTNFILEEKIGPVPIRVESGEGGRPLIWLTTPPIHLCGLFELELYSLDHGLAVSDIHVPLTNTERHGTAIT